ncbi:MAG: PAS domain S-box protein [Methylocystis sp.]|nr:PAS domain S-box protein [Methylocystis sp.]
MDSMRETASKRMEDPLFAGQANLAVLNILEDFQNEKNDLQRSSRAMLNILEDFGSEKQQTAQVNGAILNILEDFDGEKEFLVNANQAVFNILEDLEEARAQTAALNTQLEQRVLERTAELARSEERFRLLVEGVADYAIFMLDPAGIVVTWNSGAERMKGYRAEEILGRHFSCFYSAEDLARGKPQQELQQSIRQGSFEEEGWRVCKNGSQFMAQVLITPLFDESDKHVGFSKVTRNITERKLAEVQAREALRREMLLKEIHHRVKNNLQVISSLLFLQSTNVTDENTLQSLEESQSRVKSIALIHEKLYRSEDLERLDFAEYVRDLVADLLRTYRVHQEGAAFHTDIGDIHLGIDTAIPCGLIITELVTNALKHAFPAGAPGDVWITLKASETQTYVLTVRDNGVGLPADVDWRRSKSLGLKLVTDLTKQLEGTIEVSVAAGTTFAVTFKELKYKERG